MSDVSLLGPTSAKIPRSNGLRVGFALSHRRSYWGRVWAAGLGDAENAGNSTAVQDQLKSL